jgi:hypothetical protein
MPNIYVGMDVHQCSITLAVLPAGAAAPTAVEQVPNEPGPLRRRLAWHAEAGPLQVCYEASAAGFVPPRPDRLGPRLHGDRADGPPLFCLVPCCTPTNGGKHDHDDPATSR